LTTFAPTAVRASEMARCPRMAALRGLGTEQQEYDEQTRRYFARGHLYTEYVVRQLRVKHGAENVEREVEIHWPLGVGHADAYVKPSKLLCEIKSTVTPTTSSPMFDMAVQQLRIYLRFHPEAERGALYLINPSDLRGEDVFEVKLTDEDVTAIDEAVLRVSEALSGGELPDRVCRKPGEGRAHLCPFIEPCFQGWEPPPANQVSDADAVDAASRLALVKAEERQHREALKAYESARKQIEGELVDVTAPGDNVLGPWLVKRTHVERSPVFSEKAARAAGFPVEALAEFMRPGAVYETFRIEPAREAGSVDYGEDVPF
jgi:hypothetical protein